jgi:tryptophan synthase alpha chain
MPFSDPSADGPAIARASERALAKGGGFDATLRVARAVRERVDTPIVLFGYYNPLFVRGESNVVDRAADAGVDALLVVDLPLEESVSLREAAAKRDIAVIPLVAPTSRPERIEKLKDFAARFPIPFIYYVSMMGVTGGAGQLDVLAAASAQAAQIRKTTGIPVVVGFGVDSSEAAAAATRESDGVVVGSAIVRRIEENAHRDARTTAVTEFVAGLRRVL